MGILPCKLGCPLLPYMETVDISGGSWRKKNRGADNSAARLLHVGNGVGCPWAAHGFSAMGCPLLQCMKTVGSPLRQNFKKWVALWAMEWAAHGNFAMQIRLPTSSIYGNSGHLRGQLNGLHMGIFCQLLHYTDFVGSFVGNSWAAHSFKVLKQWAIPWAAQWTAQF